MPFVILLEAGHNAQVSLALGTMVFGFTAQNATVSVNSVPAEVAAQRGTRPDRWTVTGARIVQRIVARL